MNKEYLGDSVYCKFDPAFGDSLELTTENGLGPSNTIILEAEVIFALIEFLNRHTSLKVTVNMKKETHGATEE